MVKGVSECSQIGSLDTLPEGMVMPSLLFYFILFKKREEKRKEKGTPVAWEYPFQPCLPQTNISANC